MKTILTFFSVLLFSQISFAQSGLVPKQYVAIGESDGDLDKDGVNEKVVVYDVSDKEDEVEGVDRELIIFKKVKGKWTIWQRSLNAVGNSKEGGMMGDPFEDVEIKNGVLHVSQSGGSSWKWEHTDKYRYQNKQFELIGYTSMAGKPCEYWQYFDYNISTGKLEVNKEFEKCDDDGDGQEVYKQEHEVFSHKLKKKITLTNRSKESLKITTPKYKLELYL